MQAEAGARLGAAKSRVWIVLAAVLFSTGGAAVKMSSLAPVQVACVRSGLAAIALLVFSRHARRRPTSFRELLVAVAFAATMLLFVLSSRMTTAANAVFLQATAPLYVLILGPLVLRERLRTRDLATLLGMAVGMALFLAVPGEARATAVRPALGNTLAIVAGFTWAVSIIGLRWIGTTNEDGGATLMVAMLGNALVALVALPFALPLSLGAEPVREVLVLGWLGVFQIGVAYLLVAKGIGGVPAFEVSLLFLVEPVFNPIWAWWIHGERPGGLALLGGCVILAAATHSALAARNEARAQST